MYDDLPKRKNIRLKEFDYSQNGAYFITVCVKDRHELLGKIDVGAAFCRLQLSEYGRVVEKEIGILNNTYEGVKVDKYIIMPNHIHMIILVSNGGRQNGGRQNAAPTVSRMINQWKRAISIKAGFSFWQKSFHDHIIRDEGDYQNHWQYIDENPVKWAEDVYFGGITDVHKSI